MWVHTLEHLLVVTADQGLYLGDLDHTRLQLTFHSEVVAAEYLIKFHDWNSHFLVGQLASVPEVMRWMFEFFVTLSVLTFATEHN